MERSRALIELSPLAPDAAEVLASIVARLRAADDALHTRVIRELLPCVRRWAFHLLGPRADLDDAVQESLAEIASALHRFEGRSSLRTLAHRITTRTAYRFYGRKSDVAIDSFELEPPDDAETPEERLAARQLCERLHRHLEALVPARRTAIVLCLVEGLSPTEAAAVEGCTPLAMRSRLHHARAELEARVARDADLRARGNVR